MADQSLLESVLEHGSDKLVVYGAFLLALAVGPFVLGGPGAPVLFPLGILLAFVAIAAYHYRETVTRD
jgi:hypothetical protein